MPFPGIDPVAIYLGPLQVRWYGLGYLAAFMIAGWVFDKLSRDGFLPLTRQAVSDLIGVLVLGTLLGGRLGYALFYDQALLLNPLELLKVWKGGLSFHGGLLGIVLFTMLFARRKQIAWPRLADAIVLAAPLGMFLVRCANFINGELYGRLAPAWLPWGVRFPTDPLARALSPSLASGGSLNWYPPFDRLRDSGDWARIVEAIPLRHPSQLYEGIVEGLLIAVVLWMIYRKKGGEQGNRGTGEREKRPGFYAALFLILYACGRFVAEFFRQPDAQLGFVLGPFSMGQLLSVGLGIAGIAWLYMQRRSGLELSGPAT